MRWTPGGESPDIEDRRDESPGNTGFGGFGGFGGPILGGFGGRHIGIGGLLLLFLLSFVFRHFFQQQPANTSQYASRYGEANRSVENGGRTTPDQW